MPLGGRLASLGSTAPAADVAIFGFCLAPFCYYTWQRDNETAQRNYSPQKLDSASTVTSHAFANSFVSTLALSRLSRPFALDHPTKSLAPPSFAIVCLKLDDRLRTYRSYIYLDRIPSNSPFLRLFPSSDSPRTHLELRYRPKSSTTRQQSGRHGHRTAKGGALPCRPESSGCEPASVRGEA